MSWLWLALLCALSLAASDALTKRYLADYSGREMTLVRLVVPGLLLAPLLGLHPLPSVPKSFWVVLALAVPLEVVAMWLYMRAIRDSPLALTLPYLALTPLFTALIGLWLLGERLSAHGAAGIILIVAGTYLLNAGAFFRHGLLAPWRAIGREPGARRMLGVAVLYAFTSVLGKAALCYVSGWTFAAFYYVMLASVATLLFGATNPRGLRVLWRRPGLHLVIGGLFGLMVVTHFLAIERVEAAYMIAVKRTSILFGILIGAIWFREPNPLRHLAAAGLMILGVALIAA